MGKRKPTETDTQTEKIKGNDNRKTKNRKSRKAKKVAELLKKKMKSDSTCRGELIDEGICEACGLKGTHQCGLDQIGVILSKPAGFGEEVCGGCTGGFCIAEGIGPCMRDESF